MTAHALVQNQLLRFCVVGVVNTAFSFSVYSMLIYLGIPYASANLLSLVAGIFFSFQTQGRLVFQRFENRRLGRFILAWVVIYGVNVFLLSRLMALGFDAYVSGALAVPFVTALSYVAQKFFVFRASAADGRS